MNERSVNVTRSTRVNAHRLWRVVSDFGRSDALSMFGNPVERVASWRQGDGYSVVSNDTGLPIESATITLRVAPTGADRASLSIRYDYNYRRRATAWLLDRIIVRPALRRRARRIAAALQVQAMTGDTFTPHLTHTQELLLSTSS